MGFVSDWEVQWDYQKRVEALRNERDQLHGELSDVRNLLSEAMILLRDAMPMTPSHRRESSEWYERIAQLQVDFLRHEAKR